MDIQMPEIDGIRASELIREMPQHANTPIIAVTAHAIDGEREHLIKAGMNDYLAKPIDEVKLSHLLARYSPSLQPQAQETPLISPSLDWQLALRQAANKPELARDLLQMLLDFLPEVREKWSKVWRTTDSTGCARLSISCTAAPATAACRA